MHKIAQTAMQRRVALQSNTVSQARCDAPQIPCYTMEKFVHSIVQTVMKTATPLRSVVKQDI